MFVRVCVCNDVRRDWLCGLKLVNLKEVYLSPLCISLPHCVYISSPLCISLPPLCISSRDIPHGALLGDGAAGGDGGNGTATISTKAIFDREKQKYYYIPIVMWDMRGKNSPKAMTGTNTLTVTIADINDNRPKPGHQDIFVYNYKGEQAEVIITIMAT